MQVTIRRNRGTVLALLATTATLWGCSDSPTDGAVHGAAVHAAVNNSTGSAVLFDEHNASLQVGYGVLLEAHVTDAGGNPVQGARPTWRSTDASVVTVTTLPDSGFATDGARASVGARAPGSAMVIATYGATADSVHFTVERGSGPPITPPPQPPTAFDLWVRAVGFTPGADSSSSTFAPVPGSVVTFIQLPPMVGDTIATAVTPVSVPTVIASATADQQGIASFHAMPAARYRLDVQTPAASVWASRTVDYYPPYLTSMRFDVLLERK